MMKSLRRQPQQERSRQRIELILDAAAELLSEVGAAETTITAVADRTGLAPGSIYEWVADDRRLIGAVAERGLDSIHHELVASFGQPATIEVAAVQLTASLHRFIGRYESDVGLRQALAFIDSDPELCVINLADTRRNAAAIESALSPLLPGVDLQPRMLLVTHLSGSLAALIAQVEPVEAATLVAEFEDLIARALNTG